MPSFARFPLSLLVALGLIALSFPVFAGDPDPKEEEVDEDEDGFLESEGDCDDTDAQIYPGAPEWCDEEDNDCDGDLDADDADYLGDDADADGDAAPDCGGNDCDEFDASLTDIDGDGDGTSTCDGDCDDTTTEAGPGLDEICGDSLDNDCDGEADNLDFDGDGAVTEDCGGDDCDDSNPSIDPNTPEDAATCIDLIDNDCDCPGDTDGDGVECDQGDEGVDGMDSDCFTAPEADAGPDQADGYLGGVAVALLDASGTTDDNADDTLTYTWTVTPDAEYVGASWELSHDSASPFGYLRFSAEPGTEETSWDFTATVVVTDGIHTTEADDENASARINFYRPVFVSDGGCAQGAVQKGSALALALVLLGLVGLRRSRYDV
jgi:hypothetical protein